MNKIQSILQSLERPYLQLLLLCLSAPILAYLLVVTHQTRSSSKVQYNSERKNLIYVQDNIIHAKKTNPLKKTANITSENLITIINNKAKLYDIAIKRVQNIGRNQTAISLDKQPFNNTLEFIYDIQSQKNIELSDISISKTASKKPGIANARFTIVIL